MLARRPLSSAGDTDPCLAAGPGDNYVMTALSKPQKDLAISARKFAEPLIQALHYLVGLIWPAVKFQRCAQAG